MPTLKPLGNPYFDNRLAGDTQPLGLSIERLDHPGREVDVHPPLFVPGATDLGKVEVVGYV
ncbi:MAG: hypothetical protein KME03_07655 [Aphanocapsa lilacina HA4352-LM1]|jgi:hypothetical protein|nr:hypothetical protein [Aphanocapsa lilacina HA4352-LM1]